MQNVKIVFVSLLLFVLSACTHNTVKKQDKNVVKPLPQKCGNYDIVYGKVDHHGVFKKVDGTVVFLLDGLDAKEYADKHILLSGKYWYQRGGLLNPDGSDASFSVDNLLEASVIQIVDDGFDYTLIEKRCKELKEKK